VAASSAADVPAPARDEVVLVTSADDAYALPLAVMVRSALDRLDPARRLRLFVLDGGVTVRSRARVLRSWDARRVATTWVPLDPRSVEHLPLRDHLSGVAYQRLFLAELLPASFDRVLYVDADALVLADLARLWDEPLDDLLALAVQDVSTPWIDGERAPPHADGAPRRCLRARPIANYAALGLTAAAAYFNSGVLVLPLARWRAEGVGERLARCVRDNAEWLWSVDQYALNVVLAGRWRALDLRWNAQIFLHFYRSWRESPFDEAAFRSASEAPWIVHYVGDRKPWQLGIELPHGEPWRRALAATAFGGAAGLPVRLAARVRYERARWRKRTKRPRRWLQGRARALRRAVQRTLRSAARR
jgi:lipopolysaccharide biosynthesis glycosyltransferase